MQLVKRGWLIEKNTCVVVPSYLWLVSSQHIDHHLHDSLMHAQNSHQIGMLVENLVVHDVSETQKGHL